MRNKYTPCRHKIKHESRNNAWAAVKDLKKREGLTAFPYLCKHCGKWHIGKPSFKDNPMAFWENIFTKMSENDKIALQRMN